MSGCGRTFSKVNSSDDRAVFDQRSSRKPTGFSQWVVHNYDVDDDIVIEIRSRKDGECE